MSGLQLLGGAPADAGSAGKSLRADDPSIVLNVKSFGAKGDGTTDDSAAIQAAINSLVTYPSSEPTESASGGEVIFPPGTYKIGSSIVLQKPHTRIRFRGAGKKGAQLRRSANVPIFVIEGEADETAKVLLDLQFEDLMLNSATRGAWTEPLVRIRYAQFVHWRNVNFYRAGGSAIKAVRYYDGEIQNCRFDFCGSVGNPVVHFMCSEQAKVEGEAGYSGDSCNNIALMNCTWEQNPGIEVHYDGRQSNGTYNASRRMNMMRLLGAKMENSQSTERTNEPRLLAENTSHLFIGNLVLSAKGVKEGAATDWVVLKKTYNTFIDRYTPIATPGPEATAMRTGLKIEETIGTKIGMVVGSVQEKNKPEKALVEFVGENSCKIDSVYYDNNPGSAPLYAGTTPTTWFGDPTNSTIVPAWSSKSAFQGTRALASKTGYWMRYVPTKPIKVSAVKFGVSVKATKNDKVQVAIYLATAAKIKRIAKSAETAGKLNEENKNQEVALESAVWLTPDSVYYFYLGCEQVEAGTQATLIGLSNTGGLSFPQFIPGGAPPNADWVVKTESYPAPEEAEPATSSGSAPMLWAVTA